MYQKSILENGIRVVTDSMPAVRSVATGIMVDSGSRDELSTKSGLAHLTEHLMFQGTSNRSAIQIARLMDEAGGHTGAFTSRDYTCFTTTVLDDYHTYALDLLGDIFLNSLFPEAELERQKNAIIREIEISDDQPAQRADTLLKSFVWSGHSLGQPTAGSVDTIGSLTREDVIYFMHCRYLPVHIIIAAAGNVDHEDFVAQVRDAFWRMTGGSTPSAVHRPDFRRGAVIEHRNVNLVYFAVGIRALPYAHENRYAIHIINQLIGGGISSRLFRRIRESKGQVYHIGSEYQAYRDDGLLVIDGSTPAENLRDVLGQTLNEIKCMFTGDDPVDEDELWKVKKQLKAEHLIAAENTNTRMGRLATQELYFGRHISTGEIIQQIDAINVDGLRQLMTDTLCGALSEAAVVLVGPDKGSFYNTASIDNLLAGIN
ncbi:MAG: insulinase family protein [Desulfobacteraceae bacterium]|nr:insulinase family protein [Desulfobacteraceae bacterium]